MYDTTTTDSPSGTPESIYHNEDGQPVDMDIPDPGDDKTQGPAAAPCASTTEDSFTFNMTESDRDEYDQMT